jgi:peroxiredoxin
MSQRYGSVLSGIQNVYQKHGVRVIGIVCELDSPEELQQFKKDYGIDFPIFTDLDFQLVRQMGVTVTPEVVVLNAQGSVVYQGRIDDRYKERGVKTPGEPEPELQNALEDVIAGRTVKNPKT